MAKKDEKKISYAPNMGLIAGEAQVAASEAGLTNIGSSFVGGAASIFAAFKQEEKAMENKMEVYSAAFPGLEQSYFMENSSNKQIVRNFLNDQRDEYVKLAEIYENTKDRTVMDKMKAIEFSIRNLDDQIKVFNTDKAEYRKAFDDGQLASGKVYEKEFFTNIYTDNSSFVITENGDISFNKGGKKNNSKLYKDHAGNWINRNNISETYFLETYSSSYALGEAGKSFNEKATYSSINANLKATGNEGLQTIATTDLASDDSSLTFEEQWASGSLDESFYKERKIEDGTDWMFDNKNADELRGLISNYYTNVMKDGHAEGKKNYKDPNATNNGKNDGNYYGFGQYRVKTGGGGAQPVSITAVTATQRRGYLDNLDRVDGEHGSYIWNPDLGDNGMYVRDDGKEMSMFEVARDEGLIKPGESKNDFNPSTTEVNLEEKKYSNKGLATPSMLKDASGDGAAANMLNERFGFSKENDLDDPAASDYYFTPYTGGDWFDSKKNFANNIFSNDIMLIDRGTGQPVMDGKKPRRFRTGEKYNVNDLDWINNFLKDYLPKTNINTDFEE